MQMQTNYQIPYHEGAVSAKSCISCLAGLRTCLVRAAQPPVADLTAAGGVRHVPDEHSHSGDLGSQQDVGIGLIREPDAPAPIRRSKSAMMPSRRRLSSWSTAWISANARSLQGFADRLDQICIIVATLPTQASTGQAVMRSAASCG